MKFRFAPSPTGYLHVGNVRIALVNWLYARKTGGHFLLRIDDTDSERSRVEYADAILEDMRWLGLEWDEMRHQSDRFDAYHTAKEILIKAGRLYPCYETPEELETKRKFQLSRGLPPVYDRASLKLTDTERGALEAEGRKPHWRFFLEAQEVAWDDEVRGQQRFHDHTASDPVLLRADGLPTYTLSSVVDDAEFGITHIVRGEDHVSNTAVQIQLFEALGASVPVFAHLSLITTREGGISKREGGHDVRSLRTAGFEPLAVEALLAKLGTSDAIEPKQSLKQLVEEFDIGKFGRAPVMYDDEELTRLNHKTLSHLPFAAVKDRLDEAAAEAFWLSVRGNIKTLADAKLWWEICQTRLTPVIEDAVFTQAAAALLPEGAWGENTWSAWTKAVQQATGKKGRELFLPIRKALTAREDGPELKTMLPLIGFERAKKRLLGETA